MSAQAPTTSAFIVSDHTVSALAQTNDPVIAATSAQLQVDGKRNDSDKLEHGCKSAIETKRGPKRLRQSSLRDLGEEKRSEAVIKLHLESEWKAHNATTEITREATCFGEGALCNGRVAAGKWREQKKGQLLHELVCAGWKKWLEAGHQKALRVTHGSQRLLMPGEPSMWANSSRCAHVSALPDASYHHNGPVVLQYMGTPSTVSPSGTCMFAICIAPVIRGLIDEGKWYPFS